MTLVRTHDPETSHEAAAEAAPRRHNCRRLVWLAIRHHGPVSAKGLERLLPWISPEAIRGAIKWLGDRRHIRVVGYVITGSGRRARAWGIAR